MEVDYTTSAGYLKDPRFTAILSQTIKEKTKGLKNVDKVTVNLIETFPYFGHSSNKESIEYSNDGKECIINITSYKQRDRSGNHTIVPSPENVYQVLIFVLERLMKEHPETFPPNDNEDSENNNAE